MYHEPTCEYLAQWTEIISEADFLCARIFTNKHININLKKHSNCHIMKIEDCKTGSFKKRIKILLQNDFNPLCLLNSVNKYYYQAMPRRAKK